MKCPIQGCRGYLRVTHSYSAGAVRFQDRQCRRCHHFFKSVVMLLEEETRSAYQLAEAKRRKELLAVIEERSDGGR